MKNMWGKELIFPDDVLYSPELMWVKVEQEKLLIGICHVAVRAAKTLIAIDFECSKGAKISKGQRVGAVETSKVLWEIISPVSGEIIAVNPKVSGGNPASIMKDAYGEGWLFELKKAGETDNELEGLLRGDSAETKHWLVEQAEAMVPLMEEPD